MRLICDACQTPYLATDIHTTLGIATCHSCGAVHRLTETTASPRASTPAAPRPERFQIQDDVSGFSATWSWWGPTTWFMIPFTLFWNGFMVMWYSIALTTKAYEMAAFGVLHLAVGIGLLYGTAAQILNKTTLELTGGSLKIQHGPLWWIGNKQIPRASIAQLYVVERISTNKNSRTITWALMAMGKDEVGYDLVTGLKSVQEGRYLEQTLEKKMSIVNRPVAGEA